MTRPPRVARRLGDVGIASVTSDRSDGRLLISVLAALGACALLVVGGCTPALQPTTTSTPSTPTAPTTSPSGTTPTGPSTSAVPTDPGIPPAAREDSIEGAEAFVEYFMAQFNRSWTEADPTLLVPLCLPSSRSCAAYVGTAQDYRDRGLRYVGVPFDVQTVQGFEWVSGTAAVRVRGEQPTGRVLDSSGSVVETIPANAGGVVFELAHKGLWQVTEIKAEAAPT